MRVYTYSEDDDFGGEIEDDDYGAGSCTNTRWNSKIYALLAL